jgi:NYN domain
MSNLGAMRRLFGALTKLMRRCRPKQTRLAVMIDCDGVSPKDADRVLAHIPSLGRICILRAYGNFNGKSAHAWVKLVRNRGAMARHLPTLLPGKNATDIALTIDAIDILSTRRVDAFVLIASDTDFAPLAYRLREEGKDVFGFGNPSTTPTFRAACTSFRDIRALVPESPEA